MTDAHPDILSKAKDVERAKLALRLAVARVQRKCSHPKVLHAGYEPREFFPGLRARRICLVCGYEEETEYATERFEVLTTEFVKKVSQHEINRARLPGTFCPYERRKSRERKQQ